MITFSLTGKQRSEEKRREEETRREDKKERKGEEERTETKEIEIKLFSLVSAVPYSK